MPGIRKLYYSIREVSEMTGLEPHVLRFWESKFNALQPRKNRAGNRTYTEHDVETVRRIQRLVREEKYTLEGAQQALEREESGEPADSAAGGSAGEGGAALPRETLVELRAFLSDVLRRL